MKLQHPEVLMTGLGTDPSPFIVQASLYHHSAQVTIYNCSIFLVILKGTDTGKRLKDIEFPILENRLCYRPGFFNENVDNHEFCGGFTYVRVHYCEVRII